MNSIIGVTDLQRKFRPVFDEVARGGRSYVLTRGSRPEAALIPYEDYLRFQRLQEEQVFVRFDQLMTRLSRQNAAFSEDEIAEDLQAADEDLKTRP